MPIILTLLATGGALLFYLNRVRQARHIADEISQLVGDAASAARRFSYKRRAHVHPADAIDDPVVASAALLVLAARADGGLSRDEETAILRQLQVGHGVMLDAARDAMALGSWVADQGRNPDEMTRRVVRRALNLSDRDQVERLVGMLGALSDVTDPEGPEDVIRRIARSLR